MVDYDESEIENKDGQRIERLSRDEHLAIGRDGGRAIRSVSIYATGERRLLIDERTDGKLRHQVAEAKEGPGTVDMLITMNVEWPPDHYQGPMNDLLWILTPGGRTIDKLLDDGARFEVGHANDGRATYHVTFEHKFKGMEVRCELDPDHDWLPSRVDVGDSLSISVLQFARFGGHLIPVEANVQKRFGSDSHRIRFRTRSVEVNHPVPATTFGPPKLEAGALIQDQVRGKNSIEGGMAGLRVREAASAAAARENVAPKSSTPVRADPVPDSSSTKWLLVIAAIATLTIAYILKRRIQ